MLVLAYTVQEQSAMTDRIGSSMDFNIYAAPVNYFPIMMEILLAQLQQELFMSIVSFIQRLWLEIHPFLIISAFLRLWSHNYCIMLSAEGGARLIILLLQGSNILN